MKKVFNFSKTKSLKLQLLSGFFIILMIVLIIMGTFQYTTMKQYLYQNQMKLLDARFHNVNLSTIVAIKTQDDLINSAQTIIDKIMDVNMSVSIIDTNGNVVKGSTKAESDIFENKDKPKDLNFDIKDTEKDEFKEVNIITPIPKLTQAEYKKIINQKGDLKGYKFIKDSDKNNQLVIWRKIGDINSATGLIQISCFTKPIDDIIQKNISIYFLASIIALIVGLTTVREVLKITLKPLYNMTNTLEKIDVKKLNTRLPENNGQIEIDKLSVSFNKMIENIETSFEEERIVKEKMRQFVSNASHELRTPLTSIHGFVEVLLRGAAKNQNQLDLALNSILSESERLTKLVNDLLILTKLDQKVNLELKKENLKTIIEEIYPQLLIITDERKIIINLQDNIFVNVNRNQIKQVIFNLVQNAIQHTDEKKGIINIETSITKKYDNTFALLKISDNGIGIPKEQIDNIFDRFFRIESHRSRKQGGYGLGLSIVKSIVDAHNGKIEVESEIGIGTTFIIYLNLYESIE